MWHLEYRNMVQKLERCSRPRKAMQKALNSVKSATRQATVQFIVRITRRPAKKTTMQLSQLG